MRIYNIRIYFIKSIELFTISLLEYSISNVYEKTVILTVLFN